MKNKTVVFSVFGQIESVIADMMVNEGLANRIEPYDVPATVRYDDNGKLCHCALIMSAQMEQVFNKRVKELRA